MPDLKDLKALLTGRHPFIVTESHEENRVLDLYKRLIGAVHRPMFTWKVTSGLTRFDIDMPSQGHTKKPEDLLAQIRSTQISGIYLLLDFHPYLEDPVTVRMLKDIVVDKGDEPHTIVLLSHVINLPGELTRYATFFNLSIPTRDKIEQLVKEVAVDFARRNPGKRVTTDSRTLNKIVENLTGLPMSDAEKLVHGVIEDDGALTESDIPRLTRAKFDLLGQNGVLSFEYDTAHLSDVGGLANLKRWLKLRKDVFTGERIIPGLDSPKGIMLLGIQGSGKSLAAKAVAGAWNVSLLRLDFGSLYNKYHGETERNLRESLATAEVMAPCVLWIDEIEKAVASDNNDGGTSQRVLGTLLTWMAENDNRVFIVATANDVSALPPELLRKGRLDEIFFVDLPDEETRALIFSIHLKKRELDPANFDLGRLAAASVGFSGAEIEQAVVSAFYSMYETDDATMSTDTILDEITGTRPLSQVMAEKIAQLRAWGQQRAVPAN